MSRKERGPRRSHLIFYLVVVLALVAAACTGDDEQTTDTTAGTTDTTAGTTDAEVNNPGVLVHAADDEPTTLDPAQVEPGEGGETVILQVYERLLEISPTDPDLIPALATEVPGVEGSST